MSSGASSSVDQRSAVLGLIPASLLQEKVEQMAQAEAWLDNKLAELRGELNVIIQDEEAIQEMGGMVTTLDIGGCSGEGGDKCAITVASCSCSCVGVAAAVQAPTGAKRGRDADTQTTTTTQSEVGGTDSGENGPTSSHKSHRYEKEE